MEKKLYAAYGSNMNLLQMASRCPTAKIVDSGKLSGYELLFRGRHGSAYATVEPKKGGSVPVVVWEITESDEARLDRYEGYPHLYRKENIKVRVGKKSTEVMIYIMNEGHPLSLPSRHYYSGVKEGYRSAGIPLDVLETALKRVQEKDTAVSVDETDSNSEENPAETTKID